MQGGGPKHGNRLKQTPSVIPPISSISLSPFQKRNYWYPLAEMVRRCHDSGAMSIAESEPADLLRRDAALRWLMGRINFERTATIPYHQRQLKLDRMRQLLTRCGNPDAGMKIVHVAGTKGKGSTSALIAAVLQAAGYRVGVFSSPHLERIEERFAIDGQPCSAGQLADLVDRLRPVAAAMDGEAGDDPHELPGPTYFELTTAMALQHFADLQVDIAVLEVGLGGRLDATNVCLPVVSVITSISHDHTRQLGETLAEIAGEKAGIIKPGVPVISGVTDDEPRDVIAEIAREHGCRMVEIERDFAVRYERPIFGYRLSAIGSQPDGRSISPTADRRQPTAPIGGGHVCFTTLTHDEPFTLENARLGLLGRHQAANAAVAIATLVELTRQGWSISEESIRAGLTAARVPARIEYVPGMPPVVVDAAHNRASAAALVDTLGECFPPSGRTAVLSISSDKDVRAILRALAPGFNRFVVTQYQENPRAVPADRLGEMLVEQLAELGGSAKDVAIVPLPCDAWQYALSVATDANEMVVITGSFFIAAELRPLAIAARAAATPVAILNG